jgi:hypothetical protein
VPFFTVATHGAERPRIWPDADWTNPTPVVAPTMLNRLLESDPAPDGFHPIGDGMNANLFSLRTKNAANAAKFRLVPWT